MADDDFKTLHLASAGDDGDRDRIEAFRENYGRALMRLEIDPIPGTPFEIDFQVTAFSGFGMASGRLTPTRNRHGAAMADNDDVVLVCSPHGHGRLRQFGREVAIADGEAVLVSNGSDGEFLGDVPSVLHNFRFSRSLLSPLGVSIDDALMRKIPQENPVLRLLTGYGAIVNDSGALGSPDLRRTVSGHMHDLVALLIGATRDGAEVGRMRGLRAARMRAIKADIAEHLHRRDLTVDNVALRHGISPRSVRELFAGEDTTFTDYVLQQRLARVHRLLMDRRFLDRTISSIAFDAGFGDLSYFNHAFRRLYRMTPSDIRAAAFDR